MFPKRCVASTSLSSSSCSANSGEQNVRLLVKKCEASGGSWPACIITCLFSPAWLFLFGHFWKMTSLYATWPVCTQHVQLVRKIRVLKRSLNAGVAQHDHLVHKIDILKRRSFHLPSTLWNPKPSRLLKGDELEKTKKPMISITSIFS